jgi:hypothetical protein
MHKQAKSCAASTLATKRLHAWRNAQRVNHMQWDFHGLHVEEALSMMRQNVYATALLPGVMVTRADPLLLLILLCAFHLCWDRYLIL